MLGACGGDVGTGDDAAAGRRSRSGGEIALAVEQWPECLDPLTSCANSSWLSWSVLVHLQPSLMKAGPDNSLRASPVLSEEPTTDNCGVVINADDTFTVTYRLDPEAR